MATTIQELEEQLLPCPLCGGRARFGHTSSGLGYTRAEIICSVCRLTLDWEQEFAFSSNASVMLNLNPIEAWNRRYKSDKTTTENL